MLYKGGKCVSCISHKQVIPKLWIHSPFPKQQILDSSKLREFGDDNFKFDENCRKISKPIENTVGNGEIALCAIFPFPTVF